MRVFVQELGLVRRGKEAKTKEMEAIAEGKKMKRME